MDKLVQQAFEKHGVKADGSGEWSDAWTKKKASNYKTIVKGMKEKRTDPDLCIPAQDLRKGELELRRKKQAERSVRVQNRAWRIILHTYNRPVYVRRTPN